MTKRQPSRPPRGRPIRSKQLSDRLLVVRLTQDERESLVTAAKASGLTAADFVRWSIGQAILRGERLVVRDREVISESSERSGIAGHGTAGQGSARRGLGAYGPTK